MSTPACNRCAQPLAQSFRLLDQWLCFGCVAELATAELKRERQQAIVNRVDKNMRAVYDYRAAQNKELQERAEAAGQR